MIGDASWIDSRLARTLPHVVDTVLLLSALGLVWMLRMSPFAAPWLTAKIVGLVVYVLLGTVALRRGRTKRVRIAAWVTAMATFVYIVSVAITKNPAGFFADHPWRGEVVPLRGSLGETEHRVRSLGHARMAAA